MRTLAVFPMRSVFLWIALLGLCLRPAVVQGQREIQLTSSEIRRGDNFGAAVAVDGNLVVIGAPSDDDRGEDTGSVYVFTLTNSVWEEEAKLLASEARPPKHFGRSVAIHSQSIIVGAEGAAYVFVRNGTIWQEQTKFVLDDGVKDRNFGVAVGISGDYAIVGADGNSRITGKAYLFNRVGEVWQQQADLTGYGAKRFGGAVDMQGSLAIIGEWRRNAAHVFKRSGTVWHLQAHLNASDETGPDRFGRSVALHGAYALVGANQGRHPGASIGAAYIFKSDGFNWTEEAILYAPGEVNAMFGFSVALDENFAVIGASDDEARGTNSGSVYVFGRTDSAWVETAKITARSTSAKDRLGTAVAILGKRVVAGAPYDDEIGNNAGAAYILDPAEFGCDGIALPDSLARGSLSENESERDKVTYCLAGERGDLYLSFQAYDIDTADEVELLLNGDKVLAVPITPNDEWGGTQYALLRESQVTAGAPNEIIFDNTRNPPEAQVWGVRNVAFGKCHLLPSASTLGSGSGHADKIVYCFMGQPGELYLNYQAWDISDGEVEVWLNGIKLGVVLPAARYPAWRQTYRIYLPDSLTNDHSYNLIVFDNVNNPPGRSDWAIRRVSIDNCVPLPSEPAKGLFPDGENPHEKEVCFLTSGTAGEAYLLFQAFDVDAEHELQIIVNDSVVHHLRPTADLAWSNTRAFLLTDGMLDDNEVNRITFRHTGNFYEDQKDYWGVRQVSLASAIPLPFAEQAGSNTNHFDRVVFTFDGYLGDLYLYFEAFDIDDGEEVDVILNGVKVRALAPTPDLQWSGPRARFLPDSLIIEANHLNTLVFDNAADPSERPEWGVRNVAVEACQPLPSFATFGNLTSVNPPSTDEACFGFFGSVGHFDLTYQLYNSDNSQTIAVTINDSIVVREIPATNQAWTSTRSLLLDSGMVLEDGMNRIRFSPLVEGNSLSGWGVKNVSISECLPLPHGGDVGRIHQGDRTHEYQASFAFEGRPGDVSLSYQAYDLDHVHEVSILLNGTKLDGLQPGPDRAWSTTRSLRLPDSFIQDEGFNRVTFIVTPNPAHPFWWGVRDVQTAAVSSSSSEIFRSAIVSPGPVIAQLPSAQQFDQLFLIPKDEAGHFYGYRVEASDDNQNYTLVVEATTNLHNGSQLVSLPPTRARFVRILGHSMFIDTDWLQHLNLDGNVYWEVLDSLLSQSPQAPLQLEEIILFHQDELTAVRDHSKQLPLVFQLHQNYPNPFNPTTTIRFELPQASEVSLRVYNLRGELVRALVEGKLSAGVHWLRFDASGLASGVYFCRLQAGDNFIQTRKMVLAR